MNVKKEKHRLFISIPENREINASTAILCEKFIPRGHWKSLDEVADNDAAGTVICAVAPICYNPRVAPGCARRFSATNPVLSNR